MLPNSVLDICSIAFALGGGLATIGWLLFAVLDPEHRQTGTPRWFRLNGMLIAAGVLMSMGLPGFYFRQAEAAGLLGIAAFAIMFVGLVVPYVAVQSIETATAPNIPPFMFRLVSIGAPSIWVCALLMAAVTLRAGVYPAGAGYFLLAGTLFGLLTISPPPIPRWLARNVASTVFTAAVCYLGILSLSF